MPQSTVRIPTPEARIGPMVEPHPMSFLTTNSCTEANQVKIPSVSSERSSNKNWKYAWNINCC